MCACDERSSSLDAPSFLSDCLETLEDIAIEGKRLLLDTGGEDLSVVPRLNDCNEAVDLIERLAR